MDQDGAGARLTDDITCSNALSRLNARLGCRAGVLAHGHCQPGGRGQPRDGSAGGGGLLAGQKDPA
jgi:hypothetical protein